ncbi:MAG: hypothetical protein AB4062_08675 [Crocosphaera sp.]
MLYFNIIQKRSRERPFLSKEEAIACGVGGIPVEKGQPQWLIIG